MLEMLYVGTEEMVGLWMLRCSHHVDKGLQSHTNGVFKGRVGRLRHTHARKLQSHKY